MAALSLAGTDLRTNQKKHPPSTGIDRAQHLYSILEPFLPKRVLELCATGKCVIGEVGMSVPVPETRGPFQGDGSHSIELYSGFFDVIYAVSRPLAARTRVFSTAGVNEPSGQFVDAVESISQVFRDWKSGALWKGKRLLEQPFAMSDEQKKYALELATNAELFALAHEIGHVYHHDAATPIPLPPIGIAGPEEFLADLAGLQLMMAAGTPRNERRSYFLGCDLFLYILVGLAAVGHKRSSNYPDPSERLEGLSVGLRRLCANESSYWQLQTQAVAIGELMQSVINLLSFGSKQTKPTIPRIVCGLSAMIDFYQTGQIDESRLVVAATTRVRDVESSLLAQAMGPLRTVLLDEAEDAEANRKILETLIPKLPIPAREIMARALI